MAVYLPVHRYPFIKFDDNNYVYDNIVVQQGLTWNTVKWAYTSTFAHNWHPLTWLSHALDCEMFGLNPGWHHQVNVLLHALDALLLFWLLEHATGYTGRSFMVAALFALHPINVESVAWISERKTMLSMLFFLLALAAYFKYAQRPTVSRYSIVALLYALALMAKPQVITFPLILLLWDYWPLRRMFPASRQASPAGERLPGRSFSWLVLEKVPLFALCAGSAVATMYAQGRAEAGTWGYTLPIRLENAIVSYARYLGKAFWPAGLAPEYPHPGSSLRAWQVLGALAILLIISALVAAGRRHRYLVAGWLWFLITLVPMIGLVQTGQQSMADRYAYGAFIGLFIMVCWGVADLVSTKSESARSRDADAESRPGNAQEPPQPWPGQWTPSTVGLFAISVAVLLLLSVLTDRQVGYWKDDLTLWTHAASVVPDDWLAEDAVGVTLQNLGRPDAEALPHFYKAAAIHPSDELSNLHIALYEQSHGNPRDAVLRWQKVLLNTYPPQVQAQFYQYLGLAYQQLGETEKAQQSFDQAATLRAARHGNSP
ncbi:MAG: tetratricopeptide repeat protein [Candidatus Korobacteraceae bacterium]